MKNSVLTLLVFILGIFSSLTIKAQEARTVFVNTSDSLCPLLASVNRADRIDFIESKMRTQVINRFRGRSEMTKLGPDYISLEISDASNWQMKLLPLSDSAKVAYTASTVYAPACGSHARFYTIDRKELPADGLLPLELHIDNFFASSDSTDYDFIDTRLQADMTLVKTKLSKEDEMLTSILATLKHMEEETTEKLKPFLRCSAVYTWKGGELIPDTL